MHDSLWRPSHLTTLHKVCTVNPKICTANLKEIPITVNARAQYICPKLPGRNYHHSSSYYSLRMLSSTLLPIHRSKHSTPSTGLEGPSSSSRSSSTHLSSRNTNTMSRTRSQTPIITNSSISISITSLMIIPRRRRWLQILSISGN